MNSNNCWTVCWGFGLIFCTFYLGRCLLQGDSGGPVTCWDEFDQIFLAGVISRMTPLSNDTNCQKEYKAANIYQSLDWINIMSSIYDDVDQDKRSLTSGGENLNYSLSIPLIFVFIIIPATIKQSY